jgi:hypothetical protein
MGITALKKNICRKLNGENLQNASQLVDHSFKNKQKPNQT